MNDLSHQITCKDGTTCSLRLNDNFYGLFATRNHNSSFPQHDFLSLLI